MHTTHLARSFGSGALAVRPFPSALRSSAELASRHGLPVVSNRAFISSWLARRGKLAAAARLARKGV